MILDDQDNKKRFQWRPNFRPLESLPCRMEAAVLTCFSTCAYNCITASLQPLLCGKTSGAYGAHVWSVNIVESGITQRVSEMVVTIGRGSKQLEVTSVVAKGCIETGTTSSHSVSAIESRMIKWYMYSRWIKTTLSSLVYLIEGVCMHPWK